MAGFRQLCGRFCCVDDRMSQRGAESAKFSRLRRYWGIVLNQSTCKKLSGIIVIKFLHYTYQQQPDVWQESQYYLPV